jgi:hypothetical protein
MTILYAVLISLDLAYAGQKYGYIFILGTLTIMTVDPAGF